MNKKIIWGIIFAVAVPSFANAAIKTGLVTYTDQRTTLEGYYAYDTQYKKRPGVLIVHQWHGLGDYEKRRARELAEAGYVALAIDVYGKGVRPTSNDEAGKLAGSYKKNRPLLRQRVQAGLSTLQKMPQVDSKKIAAIGYCFGGTSVLELARSGATIGGVVSFHGNLDTPILAEPGQIKAKVLVLHGANDPFVPADQVLVFESEMRNANVDWQLAMYGGAVHGFSDTASGSDPKVGMAYDASADRRSWAAMMQFFKEIF